MRQVLHKFGAFLFGNRFVYLCDQGSGIVTADDQPVPFVVDELDHDDFLIPAPE